MKDITIPVKYLVLLLNLRNEVDDMDGEYDEDTNRDAIEAAYDAIVGYEQETGIHLPLANPNSLLEG